MSEGMSGFRPEITREPNAESIKHHEEIIAHFVRTKELISSFGSAEDRKSETEWIDNQILEHQRRLIEIRGEINEK